METMKRLIAAGLLAAVAILTPASVAFTNGASGPELHLTSAPSAFAMQNGGAGGSKTRKQLEDDGYTCTPLAISGGIIECTKKGSKTWTCNKYGEDCGENPLRRAPTTYTRPVGSGTYTAAP